jgi:dTDP-4-dehydrorhamnose 3,5-epimerase
MKRIPSRLDGPVLIEPTAHRDERGFFVETYRRSAFADLGIPAEMVQDNHSRSTRGIVRAARGSIFDVVVDLRVGSPTFGQWEGFALSEENMHMVYCPVGFGHGFCVTSEIADVMYKQSGYYADETERGIAYNDPDVGIDWPLPVAELIPSQRDAGAPLLKDIAGELPFRYSA